MALSEQQIQDLETAHKRVAVVRGRVLLHRDGDKKGQPVVDGEGRTEHEWECVFRKPTRAEYKRSRAMAHNPAQAPEAQENLARACVVWPPSPQAFDALLEDYPGIPEKAATALGELSGLLSDETVKA